MDRGEQHDLLPDHYGHGPAAAAHHVQALQGRNPIRQRYSSQGSIQPQQRPQESYSHRLE